MSMYTDIDEDFKDFIEQNKNTLKLRTSIINIELKMNI